jgi:hypothetical protein
MQSWLPFKLHTFYEELLLKKITVQFNYTINNFKLFGLISIYAWGDVYYLHKYLS